ncbi:uncharacterized protein MONBRDRAFT_32561 [Monosiga brevicollis MX1]|uniref:Spc7 kinetochore protein domain-containing protein n=1 Tax=Monosiga brevicollis TaxID=81824 RepID=A9V0C0_MONBE|nr:uncharacterized protein MONBRDRAFT_32561 [Monosiga brevicollis MX1]EDQ88983.1 predicted protein [Monosiga brevicollis MX1]|eukprot:XP_001746088.1 hypothetical protein [Monosiga brevicollis MX1]
MEPLRVLMDTDNLALGRDSGIKDRQNAALKESVKSPGRSRGLSLLDSNSHTPADQKKKSKSRRKSVGRRVSFAPTEQLNSVKEYVADASEWSLPASHGADGADDASSSGSFGSNKLSIKSALNSNSAGFGSTATRGAMSMTSSFSAARDAWKPMSLQASMNEPSMGTVLDFAMPASAAQMPSMAAAFPSMLQDEDQVEPTMPSAEGNEDLPMPRANAGGKRKSLAFNEDMDLTENLAALRGQLPPQPTANMDEEADAELPPPAACTMAQPSVDRRQQRKSLAFDTEMDMTENISHWLPTSTTGHEASTDQSSMDCTLPAPRAEAMDMSRGQAEFMHSVDAPADDVGLPGPANFQSKREARKSMACEDMMDETENLSQYKMAPATEPAPTATFQAKREARKSMACEDMMDETENLSQYKMAPAAEPDPPTASFQSKREARKSMACEDMMDETENLSQYKMAPAAEPAPAADPASFQAKREARKSMACEDMMDETENLSQYKMAPAAESETTADPITFQAKREARKSMACEDMMDETENLDSLQRSPPLAASPAARSSEEGANEADTGNDQVALEQNQHESVLVSVPGSHSKTARSNGRKSMACFDDMDVTVEMSRIEGPSAPEEAEISSVPEAKRAKVDNTNDASLEMDEYGATLLRAPTFGASFAPSTSDQLEPNALNTTQSLDQSTADARDSTFEVNDPETPIDDNLDQTFDLVAPTATTAATTPAVARTQAGGLLSLNDSEDYSVDESVGLSSESFVIESAPSEAAADTHAETLCAPSTTSLETMDIDVAGQESEKMLEVDAEHNVTLHNEAGEEQTEVPAEDIAEPENTHGLSDDTPDLSEEAAEDADSSALLRQEIKDMADSNMRRINEACKDSMPTLEGDALASNALTDEQASLVRECGEIFTSFMQKLEVRFAGRISSTRRLTQAAPAASYERNPTAIARLIHDTAVELGCYNWAVDYLQTTTDGIERALPAEMARIITSAQAKLFDTVDALEGAELERYQARALKLKTASHATAKHSWLVWRQKFETRISQGLQDEVRELEQNATSVDARLQELRELRDTLAARRGELTRGRSSLQTALRTPEQIAAMQDQAERVASLRARLSQLREQVATRRAALAEQEEKVAQLDEDVQAKSAEAAAQRARLESLCKEGSAEELARVEGLRSQLETMSGWAIVELSEEHRLEVLHTTSGTRMTVQLQAGTESDRLVVASVKLTPANAFWAGLLSSANVATVHGRACAAALVHVAAILDSLLLLQDDLSVITSLGQARLTTQGSLISVTFSLASHALQARGEATASVDIANQFASAVHVKLFDGSAELAAELQGKLEAMPFASGYFLQIRDTLRAGGML